VFPHHAHHGIATNVHIAIHQLPPFTVAQLPHDAAAQAVHHLPLKVKVVQVRLQSPCTFI
jgi:hypothetical protein